MSELGVVSDTTEGVHLLGGILGATDRNDRMEIEFFVSKSMLAK